MMSAGVGEAAFSVPDTDVDVGLALVEDRLLEETASADPFMRAMAHHVISSGGKRVRPRLLLTAHRAVGGTGLGWAVDAATAIELIHTASLVHDDIIDRADVRRGTWTLNARHGKDQALLAGDYLFTRGFFLAGRFDETAVGMFTEACTALGEGEALEQRWAGRADLPVDTYLEIVRKKTADVLRAGARVGAHLAGAPAAQVDALATYGRAVGMAFQVRDDVLDLQGDTAKLGKPAGLDLKRGVRTLPLLLHRDAGHRLPVWKSAKRVRRAVEASGALERTDAMARAYADEAVAALDALPDSRFRDELRVLATRVITRNA